MFIFRLEFDNSFFYGSVYEIWVEIRLEKLQNADVLISKLTLWVSSMHFEGQCGMVGDDFGENTLYRFAKLKKLLSFYLKRV